MLSMTYVEKISIYNDQLELCKACDSNGTRESIQKRQFYYYSINIFYSMILLYINITIYKYIIII
jgi:hypothetical protein